MLLGVNKMHVRVFYRGSNAPESIRVCVCVCVRVFTFQVLEHLTHSKTHERASCSPLTTQTNKQTNTHTHTRARAQFGTVISQTDSFFLPTKKSRLKRLTIRLLVTGEEAKGKRNLFNILFGTSSNSFRHSGSQRY